MDINTKRKKIEEIERIVTKVLEGESDLLKLMSEWPFPKGPFLDDEEDLRHVLDHYVADEDIRSEDVEYNNNQRQEVLGAYQKFLNSNNKN